MRVSVCVGDYAETPYCVPGPEMRVCCMEELCYCMKENAFLLDLSLLNDGLLRWIEQECGLRELVKALYPLVHKQGSLSAFVVTILRYVGFYDDATVREVEQVLKQGAGLSSIERRKSQIDYLVKKKKYTAALRGYEALLRKWQEQADEGAVLPAQGCLAAIWHNRGVAFAGMMLYARAAECFRQAFKLDDREDYCMDYLAAKRLELSEEAYVAFVAEHRELYRYTMEMEKKIEQLVQKWEQQPEYLQLYNRREFGYGSDGRRYREDTERLIQALKDGYRSSVND